jgi:hypothetical protein
MSNNKAKAVAIFLNFQRSSLQSAIKMQTFFSAPFNPQGKIYLQRAPGVHFMLQECSEG